MTPVNVTLFPRTGMLPRTDGIPAGKYAWRRQGRLAPLAGVARRTRATWPRGPLPPPIRGSLSADLCTPCSFEATPRHFQAAPVFPGIGSTGTNFQSSSELGDRRAGVQRVSPASTVLAWTIIHPVKLRRSSLLGPQYDPIRRVLWICSSRSCTEQGPPEYPCGAPSGVYL